MKEMDILENQTMYEVYRFYHGTKELIGTYQDPHDAHDAAKRYDMPQAIIQIEKVSTSKIMS